MSSGFVPSGAGTADAPISTTTTTTDDEWRSARLAISAAAARKTDARARDAASAQPSLYETLEANKIAKQEAFEEAHRLRNQFRALHQDEIDFLDSVLERTRAEEARIKKETLHGLHSFRQQQEAADQKTSNADAIGASLKLEEVESWASVTRKRKRPAEKRESLIGKTPRKSRPINEVQTTQASASESDLKVNLKVVLEKADLNEDSKLPSQISVGKSSGLGLVDYGDDDNDEW
ncbi:hypothetical protein K3495_g13655 [Podosphaera aphanis]|nr:hypothetical protein K3495_g13655 [Podosphaera aphanis]